MSRSRAMFFALVERQLRIRAKRSWFGVIWPGVAPLILLALYVFVFGKVFDVPIRHYPEFLFAGLLPWTFLAQTVGSGIVSVSSEADLIRRSPFPYELLPLSAVATGALYFLATLVLFIVYLGARGLLSWALLPVVLVPVAAVTLLVASISMVIALVDVYNHDLRQFLPNLLTVWFFLIPIVYRQNMAPHAMLVLRSIDPMNMIVGEFRQILYYQHISRALHMAYLMLVCSGVFTLTLLVFRRLSAELPKDV